MHIASIDYIAKDFFQLLYSNMKKGVDLVALRTEEGLSILHAVVLADRIDLYVVFYDLGLLKDMSNIKIENMNSEYYYKTPLELALKTKKQHKVQLERWINMDIQLPDICKYARANDIQKLNETIAKNPASVHTRSGCDGSTAVYWACVANSVRCIETLVKAGANMSSILKDGETTLTKVVSLGHWNLAEYLIRKYKLDPDQKGLGDKTALERAGETGDFKMAECLIRNGAKLDSSILRVAAIYGQSGFLQKMLKAYPRKLDINSKDYAGRSPLLLAAEKGKLAAIQVR